MRILASVLLALLTLLAPAQAQVFSGPQATIAPFALPAGLGSPAAFYSVVKPPGWNGNCAQIQRADTTALDIGWSATNICDKAAADTFCLNTTCGVSKWYDTSGNGLDAVQTTAANQAAFTNLNEWLGIRAISIQGVTGSAVSQSLRAPATCNRNALTVYQVMVPLTSYGFNVELEFADAGFTTAYAQVYNAGTALSTNLGSPISFGLYSRSHVNVIGLSSSGSTGQIVRTNGQQVTNGGLPSSQALAGLQIGQSIAGANYNGLQLEFALAYYCAAHTSAQMQAFEAAAAATFNPPATFANRLVYAGSSLIVSYRSTFGQTAAWQEGFGRGSTWETYTMAVGGQTLATECSTNLAAISGLFDPTKALNRVMLDAPSNDVANQTSFANTAAAQAFADTLYNSTLLPCVASLKATGFDRVVVPTIIARGGWQLASGNFLDDARLRYNANVVAGAAANGYTVSDRASDPFFAATAATGNLGCYSSDTVHLVNFCYGIMGRYDKAAILNFVLERDINPATNDNTPAFLDRQAA